MSEKDLIYVVEDDESIRELMKMALTSFSYDVRAFDNAEDAMQAIHEQHPSLIIFDIMLPNLSGLEATKLLRKKKETKDIPILILTARGAESDKVIGLDAGADDYITKPFGVMELGARVRSHLRRYHNTKQETASVLQFGELTIHTDTREVYIAKERVEMTYKEYEILMLLITEGGKIVTRDKLLDSIWGYDFVGETRTLDVHIRSLRKKLHDVADTPKYIKTIRNVGYRFCGEKES